MLVVERYLISLHNALLAMNIKDWSVATTKQQNRGMDHPIQTLKSCQVAIMNLLIDISDLHSHLHSETQSQDNLAQKLS